MGGACSMHVRKPKGKKPFRRPRHRGKVNIRMDLMEIGWMHLAQYRDQWQGLVNMVMELQVP